MRILFICSRETDYLQDLTYSGLSEVLGKDSVIDFPVHWQYHRERRYFWNRPVEYPQNLGLTASASGSPESKATFLEIKEGVQKNLYDLVILACAKPDALQVFCELFPEMKGDWIFIDGGDWQEVGGDFKRLGGQECLSLFQTLCRQKEPAVIFKREIPLSLKSESLVPLPFSVNSSRLPDLPASNPKDKQVAFWAVESSSTRREVFRLLRGRYDCEQNGSVPGKTFRKYSLKGIRYFSALNESKIGLSFRGEGFDTLRYWEIPACGTLLLSEQPAIEIPNNFLHEKHALFCKNDLSDLLPLIDYYLGHEKEANEIAREGQKHLFKHHTHVHRAETILEVLRARRVLRSG